MPYNEEHISELNDEIDTEFNWIMGSAVIFLFAAWIFSAAIHSTNGGRFFIFLPFFALYWLTRAVIRIRRTRNLLLRASIETGVNLIRPVHDFKKFFAWVSWPISIALSIIVIFAI